MLLKPAGANIDNIAEIRTDSGTGNRSLIARSSFEVNDIISNFYWNKVRQEPDFLTIQIEERSHIELLPAFLQCINHSCEPNAFFDMALRQLVCIRPVEEGEEITFFYPSTEWCMNRPFDCSCKSRHCLKRIAGAKYLSREQQHRYRLSPFIQQKLSIHPWVL